MSQTKTQLVEGLNINTSAPADALAVDNSGRIGIGTSTFSDARESLIVAPASGQTATFSVIKTGSTSANSSLFFADTDSNSVGGITYEHSTDAFSFRTNGSEKFRCDSSGRLLVGTSNATDNARLGVKLGVVGTSSYPGIAITGYLGTSGAFPILDLTNSRGTTDGSYTKVESGDILGRIHFRGSDGTQWGTCASIEAVVDGATGTTDLPGRLIFKTSADGSSSPTQVMQITSGQSVDIGTSLAGGSGITNIYTTDAAGGLHLIRTGGFTCSIMDRQLNDGSLIVFRQASTEEGSISVSGSTVSYNGAHLSRWSQLPGGAIREEILRGTVLSNIDEMCEWAYDAEPEVLWAEGDELPEGVSVGDVKTAAKAAGTEENEQLNRMKVSDVEGDRNVSGVFQGWDDDDDTYTDDFFCAMTGDFVIRIAQGVTVQRGDLLMSAGDGTAKPQDDDIVRSKTIAKVTSTHVSETYDDGSYCVPCVLMAC